MHIDKLPKAIFLPIIILIFTSLACNLGTPGIPNEATSAPVAQPTINQEKTIESTNIGQSLSPELRHRLASATVLILMLENQKGELVPFGWGSGTIISSKGLILTNAHVASPSAQGEPEYEPDALGIAILNQEDAPPIPTYIAEVMAVDGRLDLAVLQITTLFDGTRVNPETLNLPYVEVGDSDNITLGDNLNIFGYPGIGGTTITFTKGSVSGFTSEAPVGNRAWIKTDATIAGGNSGGLGANDYGQIIGIPTIASSGSSSSEVTDCRIVQDTNGDGILTESDNCIPIGGFINALRPINFAEPLIRSAQTGVAYQSQYDQPAIQSSSNQGAGNFSFITWAEDFDGESCPVSPVNEFPSSTKKIAAIFEYNDMVENTTFGLYWLHEGDVVYEEVFRWDYDSIATCFAFWLENDGETLPDGKYSLLLYSGDELTLIQEVNTFVGHSLSFDSSVFVQGRITDGDTGHGISKAIIVILVPGTDIERWLVDGTDNEIYILAETDQNGYYKLPDQLQKEVEYLVIAGASSQGYLATDGYLFFNSSDPSTAVIDIELRK